MALTSPDAWRERADEIFERALDLPAAARGGFLAAECGADAELRAFVERLLAAAEEPTRAGELPTGGALHGELGRELGAEIDEPAEGLVGRTLGPYRVVGELGSGGMAVVYLAERESGGFEQRVAIKVMRREVASAEGVRRFHRERQILAATSHPNVARLLDGGVTPGQRPYLVMEYVEGEPIDRFCDARRLGVGERLALFLEAARAVEHAHRNLVVHRDIKPSNILVTEDRHVKLLDFGIAKLLDPQTAEATRTELRPMTPAFASPEQVAGEALTTATDVYQLGVLLYVLLTGCWPYRCDPRSEASMLVAIAQESPTRPSSALGGDVLHVPGGGERPDPGRLAEARGTTPERLRRALAGDLDTIVLETLRKEPQDRYATVEALRSDVERYLAGLPIEARPPTWRYLGGKLVRRHKALVAAGLALVVALGAGAAGTTAGLLRAAREAEQAKRQAAITAAINDFLNEDLLAQASPSRRGADVTVREVLELAAGRLDGRFPDPLVEAGVRRTVGMAFSELGDYDAALPQLEAAVAICDRAVGPDHRETLLTRRALAETLSRRGSYDEAGELQLAVLERARRALDPDDELTIDVQRALSATYLKQGRLPEAASAAREAYAAGTRALGNDHPVTIWSLVVLANARNSQFEDATALYRQALESWERRGEADHPDAVTTRHNLAVAYRSFGRFAEAAAAAEETLEMRRRVLGPQHPDTLKTLLELARVRDAMDDPAAAEALFSEGLETTERALGADHPNTIHYLSLFVDFYRRRGRAAEAAAYEARLLPLLTALADREDASPRWLNNAAYQLLTCDPALREPERALAYVIRGREMIGDNPAVLDTLVLAYLQTGRWQEARRTQQEALALVSDEAGRQEFVARFGEYEAAYGPPPAARAAPR